LVDEDASVREAIGQALCSDDFQVVSTADQTEALAQCREHEFDALLLDVSPRVKNTWETLERLHSFRPNLPVIAMTARPEQHNQGGSDLAICALLSKPLNFTFLIETLNSITARQ